MMKSKTIIKIIIFTPVIPVTMVVLMSRFVLHYFIHVPYKSSKKMFEDLALSIDNYFKK